MKKLTTTLAALLIAAATATAQGRGVAWGGGPGRGGPGAGFGGMSAWPGSRTPVTGAPYSGVQTTLVQQTLANGNQIVRQEQAKVYRDGQGRVRIEQTSTNAGTAQRRTPVTITDPVAGAAYLLNSETKTYMQTPARGFARPPARPSNGSGFTAGRRRGPAGAQAPAGRGGAPPR